MKKWLVAYFSFTKREFNGLMVLMGLILLVIIFPYVYSLIKSEEPITEADELAVLKLALEDKQKIAEATFSKGNGKDIAKMKSVRFVFDPNTIGQVEWERLGLSARQAQSILKYRAKGGQFRTKEDLRKMYTITEQMYMQLEPYIRLVPPNGDYSDSKPKAHTQSSFIKAKSEIIELNGADTTELDKIKGIGMAFANRIVKYRARIGGFYKKEQLMEVFGLDSVKYTEIKDQIIVDVSKIKKININTVEIEDFKNHPYIRYKQVNALVQYRKQHGKYSNFADLNKVAILNQETIDRLAAYLEF
jgi:competence protein ComEA